MSISSADATATNTAGDRDPRWAKQFDLGNGMSFYMARPEQLYLTNFLVHEIFKRRRYAHQGFEIGESDTIVDIGANMGLFALWAAPQAPRGKVVCIEPTGVFDILKMNVELNGLTQVAPRRLAVGRANGELEFVHYPGQSGLNHQMGLRQGLVNHLFTRYQARWKGLKPETVKAPCVTLERLLDDEKLPRVSFLKIDCEGAEYDILEAVPAACFQRIDRIAMEFHTMGPGQDYRKLARLLEGHGYRVEVVRPFVEYWFSGTGEIWATR